MVLTEYKCIDGYNEIINKLGCSYKNLDADYKVYLDDLKNAADEFIVCKDEINVSDRRRANEKSNREKWLLFYNDNT